MKMDKPDKVKKSKKSKGDVDQSVTVVRAGRHTVSTDGDMFISGNDVTIIGRDTTDDCWRP